jgi:hypothetical protein
VHRQQNAFGQGVLVDRFAREFAQGFDFKITPQAPGVTGLRQPIEFVLNAIGKQAAALAPSAGSNNNGAPRTVAPQPNKKAATFSIALEPIQANFDRGRLAPSAEQVRSHLSLGGRSHHGTYAANALAK